MCGIVAMFSHHAPISRDALERATNALHHRGPDGQRFWVSGDARIGLGHARLSIIDLATGQQPIASEDGRTHIVVNGEFYGFEAIQRELEHAGHRLRTRSDSEIALHLYGYAAAVTERAGILLADTKFEFGVDATTGGLLLVDEVLTPDSSRFWDAATYEPGRPQASFDKQFVRDWLETQDWDKTAPGPALPPDIVAGTRARYIEAYERITGARFERYLREDVVAR